MKTLALTLLALMVVASSPPVAAQSETYSETRRLLVTMERNSSNSAFKKLFEEADVRQSDLTHALYDPDRAISLNAQSIILYLADPQGLAALDKWFEYRRAHANEYWMSPVKLVTGEQFLTGANGDLANLVVKTFHPKEKQFWAKVIASNKRTNTVIVEMVEGEIFTEGWHVTIRRENGRWRILSNYLVWQS